MFEMLIAHNAKCVEHLVVFGLTYGTRLPDDAASGAPLTMSRANFGDESIALGICRRDATRVGC